MDYRALTEQLNLLGIQSCRCNAWRQLHLKEIVDAHSLTTKTAKPSFEIRKPGNRWICYGCGRKGGSIHFVKEFQRVNFATAKSLLASKAPRPHEMRTF